MGIKFSARLLWFKRRDFLFILMWGIFLGIIVSEVYWVGYQEIRWLKVYKVPYGWYETPNPKPLDLILVLIVSVIFGALLSEVRVVLSGYLFGLLLAFLVGFAFVIFYMWRVLQLEYLFTWSDFNWEWAVFFAILNVGKIMFPYVVLLSLLGVVLGMVLRELLGY